MQSRLARVLVLLISVVHSLSGVHTHAVCLFLSDYHSFFICLPPSYFLCYCSAFFFFTHTKYTHTHTHTHTHTDTHRDTHSHTHTHTHCNMKTDTNTHTHARTHTLQHVHCQ